VAPSLTAVTMSESLDSTAKAVQWQWPDAGRGLVYALPAAIVAPFDPQAGLLCALGVLPACLVPLAGPRRRRGVILVAGIGAGLGLFIGGAIGHLPAGFAALTLAVAVVLVAFASTRSRLGQMLLVLVTPLAAAGMSYGDDWGSAIGGALLMTAGAIYAWLVSLAFPDRPAGGDQPVGRRPPVRFMVTYGASIGVGAALAYLIASAVGVDHPGWAPAACLLVARPVQGMLETRAVGRVSAVTIGGVSAVALVGIGLAPFALAALTVAIVIATAATRTSRWYITSAFTTFLVLTLILRPDPDEAVVKLNERVLETVLGVALAVVFGVIVPRLVARLHERRASSA
jgi:uncharacterized membrane protein YgaE (UPF0421/DUF939 family)